VLPLVTLGVIVGQFEFNQCPWAQCPWASFLHLCDASVTKQCRLIWYGPMVSDAIRLEGNRGSDGVYNRLDDYRLPAG